MSVSSPQPMSLSHTRKRPRTGSYSSPQIVASASEATESETVRLLAARIPPELFENILFYVNVDRVSQREEYMRKIGNALTRNRGEPSSNDILMDLKQCSLVCLFWANRCREHIFRDRTLEIKSYEDAEIFRQYVVQGCPRLTPVNQFIDDILVHQDYHSQRSFIHLLCLPAIRDKIRDLFINGIVPEGFNPAQLDTPHWGIPPSIPVLFLQNNIFISYVHLPSFHHVAKYIRHFTCAPYIRFEGITWDGQTPTYSLPQASNKIACQRRPRSLDIMARGDCTNSVHLALTALMMNPNCPLHRLSDEERVWMITFMTLLWGDEPDPNVRIGFDVSEQVTTMRAGLFHFVFEEATTFTDRSASALSVVGMHAYIFFPSDLPAKFDALVIHARTYPTIRALLLLFGSLASPQQSLNPLVEVLSTLATETIELVLAYEKEEERKAVGVDLVTLELNGRIWTDLPVLTFDRYNNPEYHLKSLYILQRQLEKKPRGRFY